MAPDDTNLDSISVDGYWRLKEGEWVATEKQITELGNGASPHDYVPVLSDDGYWELVDGHWKQSQKQVESLQEGAVPYGANQNIVDTIAFYSKISVDHSSKIDNVFTNLGPNRRMYVTIGALLTIILLGVYILSPIGRVAILDKLRDDDGDGYSDENDLFPFDETEWFDTDLDGIGNNADDDDDNDGVIDINDLFPLDENENFDMDEDGIGDNSDSDIDNDNIEDSKDLCVLVYLNWISSPSTDHDADGCQDSTEDDDDDNDGVTDLEDSCPVGLKDWSSSSSIDYDGDGCRNIEDDDDDGDGFNDLDDVFPLDSTEWSDIDDDGIGDNSDTDDDNDGVLDLNDLNPNRDAAVFLSLDLFTVHEYMDYFDNYAEVYFCVYVNLIPQGCVPDQNSYWSLLTGTTYWINTTFFIDLDETLRYHQIDIVAWDSDAFEDDLIDISSDPDWSPHLFTFDSVTSMTDQSFVADGTLDATGWDGVLEYSLSPFDNRLISKHDFRWDYQGDWYELEWTLDYSIYSQSRALSHDIDWTDAASLKDVVDHYAAFAVTDQQYVIDLANQLKNMAIQAGYASELQIAEFIYAFVGDIQYQLDSIDYGVPDYPKYPIEMLWEQNGDCEDAALLYISLTESIGYDAALMIGLVKQSEDEDWSGHAWAVIYIPDHSGDGWYGPGSKSSTPFYFVEATAHHDGISEIGRNPWYDITDFGLYDVE